MRRAAWRGEVEARFIGDPVAYARLVAAWAPLVEFFDDLRQLARA